MFGLNKRELEAKFTKSEVILLGWRSQEMSYALKQMTDSDKPEQPKKTTSKKKARRKSYGGREQNLPDHFFNEEGDIDLRQVKAEEAWRFLAGQGMKLPILRR